MIYFWNGKKIGGILVETKLSGEYVKNIVLGIGINTISETFREDIINIATSIKKELKIEIKKNETILEFCKRFEEELIKRKINF